MPKPRPLVFIATVATLAILLAACRTGSGVIMWGPCDMSGDTTGTDGSYALVCHDGTWEPTMTVDEFVRIATGHHVSVAPLPARPTTTSTSTTSSTSTSTTSSTSTSTSTSTTTTTTVTCVQSCDGADLTASVNRQPSAVWGYISGTGLKPGATVTLCDSVAGCFAYTTVSPGGTFSVGPSFCCDASRTSFYAISTTAASGLTIMSNSVSH